MLSDVLTFLTVGFAAQLVDGAIGMAYGLTSTTILLSVGVPPAMASASVHAAEVFTTGASGISHWRLGNVDGKLFRRLAVPGAIGGAAGAYLLTELPGDKVQPFVSAYLAVMGGLSQNFFRRSLCSVEPSPSQLEVENEPAKRLNIQP